ncbi:MAG: pre-mRNA-splicing factor prp46, partial [Watsoniomyces obsoletus]
MSHLLRGRQAGIQTDLSAGIFPELLDLDEIARYGVNSQTSALAFDPVQSLLAVGTNESRYGSGQVYIFGQGRVHAILRLPRKASVTTLRFCADKLLAADSKNEISLYSLETKQLLSSYTAPGSITAITTDPSLDWVFIGLQTGDVVIFDLERFGLAPLRLPNFWKERSPKSRLQPVVALELHPRDVGKLLIGYVEGAVIYSFKQNKPTIYFQYELPPGAPGGAATRETIDTLRHPKLTQALWHPTGTFVLTGHEDSSIVIWDLRDGRVVLARTLQDVNVNKPRGGGSSGPASRPLVKIAWCSKQNPDDTGLLIAGGSTPDFPSNGLTFLDLGLTPNYATSSWQIIGDHFANPKRQHMLPTPPHADVVDFCLFPHSSPHYAGSHDPIAILALLATGELVTMSFPTGHPIPAANQLHVSLSFVHPFPGQMSLASVEPSRWTAMKELPSRDPPLVRGGVEASHPRKRYEGRTILQMVHDDGTIRLWDPGHGDEIDNQSVVQADLAMVLGQLGRVEITNVSMASATGELAVGTRAGEVVVFRWGRNDGRASGGNGPAMSADGLTDITDRAEPSLQEGLLPLTLYKGPGGPVTALKMSDIGFLGVAFESGSIAIIDMRGPAVIYNISISSLLTQNKRRSVLGGHGNQEPRAQWPTVIEFGILSLDGDDYSSICCFVGINVGQVATFKLLPQPTGGYRVQYVGHTSHEERVILISPINIETGAGAYATQSAASRLASGFKVNGALVVVGPSSARIFKPASAKGAQKTWDDIICHSAAVVNFEGRAHALVGVFGDGSVRVFSLPAFKALGATRLRDNVDMSRLSEVLITESGFIFAWTGPSEIAVFNIWGNGKELPLSTDQLFHPEALIPPRPTISNLQWISGSQYVTPADMDLLIGGPDRPISKAMLERSRTDDLQRRGGPGSGPGGSSGVSGAGPAGGPPSQGQEEGYWAYMQRQINERTEKLNLVGDSMEQLQEQSAGWAKDVNKYVNQTKRKVILG